MGRPAFAAFVSPIPRNSRIFLILLALMSGVTFSARYRAQTVDVSGRYQCIQVKVQNRVVACTAAPLILRNDGRFELRGWEGSYLVNGQWVELSDSLLKARGKIEPGHRIVLHYYGKKGFVEIIYERRVAELGKTALG